MLAKLRERLRGDEIAGGVSPGGDASANDPSFDASTADESSTGAASGTMVDGEDIVAPAQPNPISRTVDEIVRLLHEIEDAREELMARGVQNQTLNVLVEFGFHDRTEGREILLEAALSAASEAYGINAIDREELEHRLAELLALEHDVSHCRRIARQQGIDLQVLNFMTRLIHKNPGDGGERAVNTFFGYAFACGIPLEGIADVAQRVGGQPKSVLPDLDRAAYARESWATNEIVRDVALGLCLGLGMLWLLV